MTSRSKLTTIDDHHHQEAEDDEEDFIETLPSVIFDASYCGEPVPQGFDAVRILIDGKVQSDLSWKKEKEAAIAYVKQGLRIFWEIDLGLPDFLHNSLSDRTQFLSLSLSLEHFRDAVWKDFRKETVGLCLYRGSADFSNHYPWDEEQILNLREWVRDLFENEKTLKEETQIEVADFANLSSLQLEQTLIGKNLLKLFCRDAIGEYLNLLASRLPDNLPIFILFDIDQIEDPLVAIQLITKERYPRFHIGLKNSFGRENQILGGEIAWEGNSRDKGCLSSSIKESSIFERSNLGFCLPKMSLCRPASLIKLKKVLVLLESKQMAFRVIPEMDLAAEWNGLDYLIVNTSTVELQFKRKLQGFCAAGGTVVSLGTPIGLAQEISFDEFLER